MANHIFTPTVNTIDMVRMALMGNPGFGIRPYGPVLVMSHDWTKFGGIFSYQHHFQPEQRSDQPDQAKACCLKRFL